MNITNLYKLVLAVLGDVFFDLLLRVTGLAKIGIRHRRSFASKQVRSVFPNAGKRTMRAWNYRYQVRRARKVGRAASRVFEGLL